jgi:chitinase
MLKILILSSLIFSGCTNNSTGVAIVPNSVPQSSSINTTLSQSYNSSSHLSSSSLMNSFYNPAKPWVVASYPSWKNVEFPLDSVPWNSITHIRYAFAVPRNNASLELNVNLLQSMALKAHSQNKEVILAIGGGAGSAGFAGVIMHDSLIQQFTKNTMDLLDQYKLDGIVIDWEHWPSQNLPDSILDYGMLKVLKSLYPEIKKRGKHLGIDVYASGWFGIHTLDEDFQFVDYLNIMTLDDAGSWSESPSQHSSYSLFTSAIAYWKNRVGPLWPGQISVTLPYYGKVFKNNYKKGDAVNFMPYSQIVKMNALNAFKDTVHTDSTIILHSSLEFLQPKLKLIQDQKLMGVVNWEQTMDTRDSTSQTFQAFKYLYGLH